VRSKIQIKSHLGRSDATFNNPKSWCSHIRVRWKFIFRSLVHSTIHSNFKFGGALTAWIEIIVSFLKTKSNKSDDWWWTGLYTVGRSRWPDKTVTHYLSYKNFTSSHSLAVVNFFVWKWCDALATWYERCLH